MYRRLVCLIPFVMLGLILTSSASADLVGWWKLDGNFDDSSGNGHDGTAVGAPTFAAGHFDQAVVLNGSSDYVNCGPNLSGTTVGDGGTLDGYTMAFWVNRTVAGDNKVCGDLDNSGWDNGGGIKAGIYNNILEVDMRDSDQRYFSREDATEPLGTAMTTGAWYHIAVVFDDAGDTMTIYLDGVVDRLLTVTQGMAASTHDFYIGADTPNTGHYFNGLIDDVRLYDSALSQAEVLGIMAGRGPSSGAATAPLPADEATDVPRDVVLGWTSGEYAATHDVYFGASFDDVNAADIANPLGVLVGSGQTANTLDPDGLLAFGRTYYWRIDEVNAPPTSDTVFKGNIWSFTAEPLAYPVANVTTTASIPDAAGMGGPEKTVDGSGLDTDGQHSIAEADMWQGDATAGGPVWIQYDFDAVYKLHEMRVWNYNILYESFIGFGLKDVTIEYAADPNDWVPLGDFQLPRAPGKDTYAGTTVDLGGIAARSIRIVVHSNWGTQAKYGLSEVRFSYIPVYAREPKPASGATGMGVNTTLDWRAGREAVSHEVYFGSDEQAVINGAALIDTVAESAYDPGTLNLGTTYYWKISEVNDAQIPSVWEGDVWDFTTQGYVVVEDFESYTDDEGNRIYETWVDGYGITTNGSLVGHDNPPYAEKTTILSGAQSMPFYYNNTAGATLSEAEWMFDVPSNWTAHGIKTLSLRFRGSASNGPGQLYLKVNGQRVNYDGAADDLTVSAWLAWTLDLPSLGVNLSSVTSLAIGVEGAGALGLLYVDDVRLYPQESEMIAPVAPDPAGLTAYYALDSGFQDGSGKGNHAQAVGDTVIATDAVRGQVAALDGMEDGISVPAMGTPTEVTLSVWVKTDVEWLVDYFSIFHDNGWEAGDIHMHISNGGYFTTGVNGLSGGDLQGTTLAEVGQWYHVAITLSASETALYVNGIQESVRIPTAVPESFNLGEGHLGIWQDASGTLARALTGQIDEVRFYTRALSAAEVAGLAGRTAPLYKPF